ncbi:MAG TPA: extracellular solute-binding protein, partial [Candidatus Woesebacteria bacterium]|nr:extracellular solute-binding protein [Candidatus Woesebacteria bacterium]
KEVFDPVIQEYQKQNPHVTIQYEKMAPEDYRERLIARSQAGNGPDIFRFHNTWIPEIQEVVQAMPAEIMSNEEFETTFYPIHVKDLKVQDKFYGIPLMLDAVVLIYNDSLLTQAGLVEPPAVWVGENDVLTAVNALTVRNTSGSLITSGMAIGTANNVEHYGEIFGILLLLNGGNLQALDQKEAAEALQLYRRFAEENYWNESMSNSIPSFIQGRTAMIFGPTWQVADIKSQNPEINVQVAVPPKGLDGKGISIATYWVEGVNKFSKNQVEAWKFLKFLSSKQSQTLIFEQQSKVRPFGIAYSRKDMGELLKSNQYVYPVVQMAAADELVSIPVADRTQDKGLNDEILSYLENAINQTANGVDYTAALTTAKQGIDSVLERYKIQQ